MGKIAIIGGGHVGQTLLADLVSNQASTGQHVKLLFFSGAPSSFAKRIATSVGRTVLNETLTGTSKSVDLRPEHYCGFQDAGDVIRQAGVIFITLPDIPSVRLPLFDWLVQKVDLSGKTIVLIRGGQGGQLVVAHRVRNDNRLKRAHIVFVEDSLYGTRATPRRIDCKRKFSVNIAVYSRTPEIPVATLRALFPPGIGFQTPSWPDFVIKRGTDLLFHHFGHGLHVGIALWPRNLKLTQQGIRYNHYVDGVDRSLALQLDALDRERVALAACYGAKAETFPEMLHRQYGLPIRDDFFEMMQSCRGVYTSMSASSVAELARSRYLHEDVPVQDTIDWLARGAGIELSATAANSQNMRQQLGLIGLTEDAISTYRACLSEIETNPSAVANLVNDPHAVAFSDKLSENDQNTSVAWTA